MRHVFPFGLFLALVFGLVVAWSHRYEADAEVGTIRQIAMPMLGERSDRLEIGKEGWAFEAGGTPRFTRFALPGAEGAVHLHVRLHASSVGLSVGKERWDDGRMMIEWHDPEAGGMVGISRLHSARDDSDSGVQTVVLHAPAPGCVPLLRFENLGSAGSFILHDLEITPARETWVWRVSKWLLLAGFAWALAMLANGTKKPAHWRGWVAASIWLVVAWHYVVPGPWESTRPFGTAYSFAETGHRESAGDASVWMKVAEAIPPEVPELGKLDDPDDLGLRLKMWLPSIRPMLHITLHFAPVLAMAWWVGWRRAMWLGLMLSISIEAAQVMFGYGFDWKDVGDLIFNSIGIAGAVWVHRKFAARIHSSLPVPFPKPA